MKFPTIRMVPRIAGPERRSDCQGCGERPAGRYSPNSVPPVIEFSREECGKANSAELVLLVCHEVGHWFHVTCLGQGVPDLASEEQFANDFACHMTGLGEYGGMARLLRGRKREITKFINETVSKVGAAIEERNRR